VARWTLDGVGEHMSGDGSGPGSKAGRKAAGGRGGTAGSEAHSSGASAGVSVPRPRPSSRPRAGVVDSQALLADALRVALRPAFDVVVVLPDDASTPESVQTAALRARPDVVIVRVDSWPAFDSDRLLGGLAMAGVRVVMLTAAPRDGSCPSPRVPNGGRVPAVVSTHDSVAVLRQAIEAVLGEPPGFSLARVRGLRASGGAFAGASEDRAGKEARARLSRLTRRERSILEHLMLGHTSTEIARADVVSEATVRTQVRSILLKLDVSSQLSAVAVAHRGGWRPRTRLSGPGHLVSVPR
jgi:two-component system, NarL family, nitrate/nitrite response regulator NarL